jgi:hypothetical protein
VIREDRDLPAEQARLTSAGPPRQALRGAFGSPADGESGGTRRNQP